MQVQKNGIYTVPFSARQVLAVYTGREYPFSKREAFLKELSIDPASLRLVKQVHGDIIVTPCDEDAGTPEGDGLIATDSGMTIGILTADCIPVFFWDAVQGIGALAHAGWRGLKAGIIPKMIRQLRADFETRPSTLQMFFGPAIRKCCYEVGEEFKEIFPEYYEKPGGAKAHIDLIAIARDQAAKEGVPGPLIMDSGACTSCQNDRFYSARKDKSPERILSILHIK